MFDAERPSSGEQAQSSVHQEMQALMPFSFPTAMTRCQSIEPRRPLDKHGSPTSQDRDEKGTDALQAERLGCADPSSKSPVPMAPHTHPVAHGRVGKAADEGGIQASHLRIGVGS